MFVSKKIAGSVLGLTIACFAFRLTQNPGHPVGPILALVFVLVWIPPTPAASLANGIHLAVMVSLFFLAFTIVVCPYLSMLPEMTADPQERVKLTAWQGVFNIIGVIGGMDGFMLPDAKGHASMVRYLLEETDELRQQIREEVLTTTADHFRAFADVLDQVAAAGDVVVLGSPEAIAAANARGDTLRVQRVL